MRSLSAAQSTASIRAATVRERTRCRPALANRSSRQPYGRRINRSSAPTPAWWSATPPSSDKNGHLVTNLPQDAFTVYENGVVAADQGLPPRRRAGLPGTHHRQQRQHARQARQGRSRGAGAGQGFQPRGRSLHRQFQRRGLPGQPARQVLHQRHQGNGRSPHAHRFARRHRHARRHPHVHRSPEGEGPQGQEGPGGGHRRQRQRQRDQPGKPGEGLPAERSPDLRHRPAERGRAPRSPARAARPQVAGHRYRRRSLLPQGR